MCRENESYHTHLHRTSSQSVAPQSTDPSIRDLMKSTSPRDQAPLGQILDKTITERNRQSRSESAYTANQQEAVTGVKRKRGEPKEEGVVYCNSEKEEEDEQPPRKKQWTTVEFYLRLLREATFMEREYVDDIVVGGQDLESENKNAVGEQKQTQRKQVTLQDRASRFGATDNSIKYDEMKKRRAIERELAIRNGTLPDPNVPTPLEEAISLKGTCEEMCPAFEMLERELQNNVDAMELSQDGQVDPTRMIKAYRRSAAGNDQPLPSEVITPDALCRTMDYLIDEIVAKNSLKSCHSFVRDRTRAIRQEFTRQNIRDHRAISVFEKIARFHIVCLHEMSGLEESKFSHQQEMEQLKKVLMSLVEFYDDLREDGMTAENEGEFRAYHILVNIKDQDVVRQSMSLPLSLFKHPTIRLALKFHGLTQRSNEIMETSSRRHKAANIPASQNNYREFFKLVGKAETPFLMACILEAHFSDIRKGALKAMNLAYVYQLKGVPASYIQKILCYDTIREIMEEAKIYGLVVDESLGEPTVRFGQKHFKNKLAVFREPLTNPPQRRSEILVEPKKSGLSFKDIVRGRSTV